MDLFRKLVPFLKPHMRQLLFGICGMGVFTLLSLIPPLLLRSLMNDVVQPGAWDLLPLVIGLIVVVPLLSAFIHFGNTQIIMLSGYRLTTDMRKAIYRKILALSMRFHQNHSSGVLVNRLMDDVNMLQRLITGDTVNIIIDLIVFIFSVSIVFSLSPLLAGILLVILVTYTFAYRIFSGRIRRETSQYRYYHDRISERLQETVAGVRHVRIFNRELLENSQFLTRTGESLQHAVASNVNSVGLSTVCNSIAGIGSAIMASLGAWFVMQGRLQYGDVLAINSYIWMALNPAIRLTNLAGQLTETFVSVRRVVEILDEPIEIASLPGALPIEAKNGRVEFRTVDFSYIPETPLYRGLSLEVPAGTTVALVGQTGCGKTTLTTLLMRYWDIQGGEILIDGQDIRKVDLISLRDLFGVVLQDPVIFDGTFAENIAYSRPGVSRERIEAAARAAEVYDLARRLPDGFDTMLGTHGVKLSVGEKQRLSIARAILKDPLILIMDEATSSLDSESEALIQRALARVLIGRTSFIVAHRLSTIVNSDIIVVMDKGRIIEKGRHAELMAMTDGTYRQLYEELQGGIRRDVQKVTE